MQPGPTTRVDLHVKVLDDRVMERARRAGLDAIVYAPHFTRLPEIKRQAASYSSDDVRVIPARELFTGSWRNRKHLLAIGLTDPVPDFISLEAAMNACTRQGGAVLVPHPEFATVSLSATDIEQYRNQIDAIEIFNPKHLPLHNRRARTLADRFDLPPFASSYAHLSRSVGTCYTEFDAAIDSETTLVEALQNGVARSVVYDNGPKRYQTTALELAHLCYENSWQKIDRLFLSATEPTHPRHIAYGGAYDDVSVY